MRFRYKDRRGKVIQLEDVTWLAQAVRDGAITPDTPLALGDEREFRRAELVVAYQQVVVGLERNRLGTAPPITAAPARTRTRTGSPVRAAVAVILGLLILALVVFVVRAPGSPPSAVSAVESPGPAMQAARDSLEQEFGDSIAVRQRRLEEWAAAQRFAQRLEGRALQSPASLRGIRIAAAGLVARADSLMAGISVLSARLVLRADSLEGVDGTRAGLFAAAGDALREWETDLSAYAVIQRATAAGLDSLAEFTLSRQQSFVIRDGAPVFLSREDAARFRQLRAELDALAARESRWADDVLRKRPRWMEALPPADRPAFRRAAPQRSNQ